MARGGRVPIVAAFAFAIALALSPAAPATAQSGERVVSYDVDIAIGGSGDLLVEERIRYDFGGNARRGIFRDLVLRLRFDGTHDRVYRLSGVSVETSPGTPGQFALLGAPSGTRIRVGDPDRTITGVHAYVIRYRIEGALNGFADHDELFWNAIGPGWSVPVERATVTVSGPGRLDAVACFAGPVGSSLGCDGTLVDERTAGFGPAMLAPGEVLTVVAGFPKGLVPEPEPILDERWSLDRAFSRTPLAVGGFVLLLLAGAAGVAALVWRHGRDRQWAGSFVDATFGNVDGTVERVPLGGHGGLPVEFLPPDGLRAGQVGTLVDEQASPVDVTATIVDLAVRGFLRIEEIPKSGWFSKPDWRLVRLRDAGEELLAYERELFDSLFRSPSDGAVELSSLRTKFASRMRRVQDALYRDAVTNGWFRVRPDRVRVVWRVAGGAVAIVGAGLTVLLAATTRLALVPVAVVVVGLALLVAAGWMPHRTPKGTGVLRRALGFRQFIEESERERARFAEQAHLFTEYLPYAIVFGATEKWAKAFEGLAEAEVDTGWYVGSRPFTYAALADSMDSFTVTTAGTLTSTPSGSGGSGFGGGGSAGGGGGGGGGGSW